MATRSMQSHGFVWPDGLPNCTLCGKMPNDPIHVTPARPLGSKLFPLTRVLAASSSPGNSVPLRAHAYAMAGGTQNRIPCSACGETISGPSHLIGAPAGTFGYQQRAIPEPPSLASEAAAVVVEGEGKLVLATKAASVVDLDSEMAYHFGREMAQQDGPHLWLAGRYVGADERNRNGAYWSSGDLEMGQPSVAHGPVNWLHEERHVIGAIAGSRLVDRQVAAEGLGTHIVALAAVWPWIYPEEANIIRQASEANSLWLSMECVSREVACIDEACGKTLSYREYMTEKASRCDHMAGGRRFVDPIFEGVGIIVPPVRPGWAHADARVTVAQAESLVERQAASFTGMGDEDAAALASQLLETSLGNAQA